MIYASVDATSPVQQGDIFRDIPWVDFSLQEMAILDEAAPTGLTSTSWSQLLQEESDAFAAVLPVKRVSGIVITQTCDAARGTHVCLSRILPYVGVVGQGTPVSALKWANLISRQSRDSLRHFYLPQDDSMGFRVRMAVDFRLVLPVKRVELEGMRGQRVGRLNELAYEHFRETLAQFFRRYPYNEWYPFTKAEFEAYVESRGEHAKPYPWQE